MDHDHEALLTALNVFITREAVTPTSDGPLSGWDVAVKDNIDVKGLITTAGTKYLAANVAEADATVIRAIRMAGGRITGKTNMHELGHGISGINPTFGTTLHPRDRTLTVGGSSGGSALAVLLGAARAALGTDTGGSVRIPASYCGLVGFRPSTGRYSSTGMLGISRTRDTVGIIAQTVPDIRAVDQVIASQDTPMRPLTGKIAVLEEALEQLDDAARRSFEATVDQLALGGVEIHRLSKPRHLERCFELGLTLLSAETLSTIRTYLDPRFGPGAWEELISASETPDTRAVLQSAQDAPVTKRAYEEAACELRRINDDFSVMMNGLGITHLIYPTVTSDPPSAELGPSSSEAAHQLKAVVLNSTPATLFGTPAISIPTGQTSVHGIPLGLTIEGFAGTDEKLLDVAEDFATLLP